MDINERIAIMSLTIQCFECTSMGLHLVRSIQSQDNYDADEFDGIKLDNHEQAMLMVIASYHGQYHSLRLNQQNQDDLVQHFHHLLVKVNMTRLVALKVLVFHYDLLENPNFQQAAKIPIYPPANEAMMTPTTSAVTAQKSVEHQVMLQSNVDPMLVVATGLFLSG